MRKNWKWGAALCLGACWVVTAGATEPSYDGQAARPGSSSWLSRWLPGKKADEGKPRSEKEPEKVVEKPARPSADRAREEADYFRRVDVCLRLQQIAEETQDQELQRLVEQLDRRVFALYQERLKRLPASPAFTSDEQVLEDHLGEKAPRRSWTAKERNEPRTSAKEE